MSESSEPARTAPKQRRQIDLDPIVLVLLGIGVITGARAIRGYGLDGADEQDRLNMAVAVAVLALAWVRPILLRRQL